MTDAGTRVSPGIRKKMLPPDALLQRYVSSGDYTDCFVTDIDRKISFAAYVEAFYTTIVFKTERLILGLIVSRPSTDGEAVQLGQGEIDSFAAWRVEERRTNQLLLTDFRGRTRSWLMVEQGPTGSRLYFGSAVIRQYDEATGTKKMAATFGILLGFHKLYSRILLAAARYRLQRQANITNGA